MTFTFIRDGQVGIRFDWRRNCRQSSCDLGARLQNPTFKAWWGLEVNCCADLKTTNLSNYITRH